MPAQTLHHELRLADVEVLLPVRDPEVVELGFEAGAGEVCFDVEHAAHGLVVLVVGAVLGGRSMAVDYQNGEDGEEGRRDELPALKVSSCTWPFEFRVRGFGRKRPGGFVAWVQACMSGR